MPKKFLYFFPENDSLFETPVKMLFIQHRVDWTSFKNAKHYLQFWVVRIVIVSHILLHSLCVLRAPGKEEGNTNDTNKSCIRESVNHHQLRTKGKKKHDYCPTQTKLCFLLLPLIFRWFLERLTVSLSLVWQTHHSFGSNIHFHCKTRKSGKNAREESSLFLFNINHSLASCFFFILFFPSQYLSLSFCIHYLSGRETYITTNDIVGNRQ